MAAVHGAFLKRVYELYGGELIGYLRAAMGNSAEEADDIVQTAFTKLAALNAPDEVANPRAFLYATARHLIVDGVRRRTREAQTFRTTADCNLEPKDELSPERVALGDEALQIVEEAITHMPPRRRRVFILSRVHNLSYAEIARETGLTVAGVKLHVVRGLADCRRALARSADDRAPIINQEWRTHG